MNYRLLGCAVLVAGMSACSSPSEEGAGAVTPPGEVAQAKRVPGQPAADPLQIFRAFGNEPFWGVRVEGDQLTFTTPDDPSGQVMHGQRRALDDGLEISGKAGDQAFVLTVKGGLCNDGMSDNEYQWTSEFKLGEESYQGCAEVAK